MPLTPRGTAVNFLTGHLVDWEMDDVGVVDAGTTLVIYVGLSLLRGILIRGRG